jgi:hypothetical protein
MLHKISPQPGVQATEDPGRPESVRDENVTPTAARLRAAPGGSDSSHEEERWRKSAAVDHDLVCR